MRLAILSLMAAHALLGATGAEAQSLVSEEVSGNRRLCNYGGDNTLLTGSPRGRQYAVGVGENCPLTYPLASRGRTAPPTAPLRTDSPSPEGRICVYEQWGSTWTFNLGDRPACPPSAGMIARDPNPLPDRTGLAVPRP